MPKKLGYAKDNSKKTNSNLKPNQYSYKTKRSDMKNKKLKAPKYKK